MPNPWYKFKAQAEDAEVAEVSILDAIHPWFGVNAVSYLNEFRAKKANKVRMLINSPGGSVTEALAMFNGMRATGKTIEAYILGIAASAASYLAMAAHKVVMPKNTMMLLHKPMTGVHGNADELRAEADALDSVESLLLGAYKARYKGTEEELKALLAEDRILTAQECFDMGFCDELVDEVEATASFDLDMLPPEAAAAFKRAQPTAAGPILAISVIEAEAKAAGLEQFAGVFALDPRMVSMDVLKATLAEAKDILALGKLTTFTADAEGLVRGRKSLVEARKALSALAEKAAGDHIDTAKTTAQLTGPADKQFNPTALWAQINARKAEQQAAKAGSKKQ